jgi:hypothetical protein
MEHRGVRYVIRIGIERGQWHVAVHPYGSLPRERTVFGTRDDALFHAHSMIDAWLRKKQSMLKIKHQSQAADLG